LTDAVYDAALLLVATGAGAVASIAGFGIGSLLTPALALRIDLKTAVAAASVPHFVGTAIRFWLVRDHVNRSVLRRFGLMSAVGGLAGALLHASASSPSLAVVFGSLLVFAGAAQLTGYAEGWRFHGWVAWAAGAASGLFGGLVGNQGGIRSAALLGFDLEKDQFVATATAIALAVDGARMPVYLATSHTRVASIAGLVGLAIAGVVFGTLAGSSLLRCVPERRFRQVVGALILLLGVATLLQGLSPK
jgi:uncharacterized protein